MLRCYRRSAAHLRAQTPLLAPHRLASPEFSDRPLFFIGINGRLGTFSAGVIGWLIKEDQDIFSA
jgi:hypothetical protein